MKPAQSPAGSPPPEGQSPRTTNWSKLPWLRWSFDAWLRDAGLRMCSPAARGIWMDLLAIAAASDDPGTIIIAGEVPSTGELAKLIGIRKSTFESCLGELERRQVFSRDSRGAIYSRRMKREASDYLWSVREGAKGGNPMLLGGGDAAGSQQCCSRSAADPQRYCSDIAADLLQNCTKDRSNNKRLSRNRVNPPVKADSDKDSDSEKKGNPDGFLGAGAGEGTGKVVPFAKPKREPVSPRGPVQRRSVERVPPTGSPSQIQDEDRAIQLWNMLSVACSGRITPGRMTAERRRQLRTRLKEAGGLDGWQRALNAVERSDLWMGRVGNGWRPCFDDILSKRKLLKLLEGGYPGGGSMGRGDPNGDLYARHGLSLNAAPDDGGFTLEMEDEDQ